MYNYLTDVKYFNKEELVKVRKFNQTLFSETLKGVRGEKSQDVFSKDLGINRATLSLYENGKQTPSLEVLNKVSELSNHSTDYFFEEEKKRNHGILYLMGTISDKDKEVVTKLEKRIFLEEKYNFLYKQVKK